MPVANRRRYVGHSAVFLAIRPFDRRTAAKTKIPMPGIASRPAAGSHNKPINFCGDGSFDGQARVGRGFRRRLDGTRSRRLKFAVAVHLGGGDGDGSLLDLVSCHHLCGHEVEQNGSAARDAATAVPPASHTSLVDVKPPGDVREAERAEHLAELDRDSRQVARFHVNGHST